MMLEDIDRAHTMRESARRWPYDEDASEATNSARAVRRLAFRRGVEWALEEIRAGRISNPREESR